MAPRLCKKKKKLWMVDVHHFTVIILITIPFSISINHKLSTRMECASLREICILIVVRSWVCRVWFLSFLLLVIAIASERNRCWFMNREGSRHRAAVDRFPNSFDCKTEKVNNIFDIGSINFILWIIKMRSKYDSFSHCFIDLKLSFSIHHDNWIFSV